MFDSEIRVPESAVASRLIDVAISCTARKR